MVSGPSCWGDANLRSIANGALPVKNQWISIGNHQMIFREILPELKCQTSSRSVGDLMLHGLTSPFSSFSLGQICQLLSHLSSAIRKKGSKKVAFVSGLELVYHVIVQRFRVLSGFNHAVDSWTKCLVFGASLASLDLFVRFTTFHPSLCLWWRGSWGSQSYLALRSYVSQSGNLKKGAVWRMGSFADSGSHPFKRKHIKKNHRRNQLQSTTRRRNSETECKRHVATLGIHSMWQTWQNTFFFPECGAATGSFQRFSTNMVGMFPKESQ